METVPLPPSTKQNTGLAFSNPKYNLDLLFAYCFQVRRVRLVASYISRNKNENCADFLLIFVLFFKRKCRTVCLYELSISVEQHVLSETVIKSGRLAEQL